MSAAAKADAPDDTRSSAATRKVRWLAGVGGVALRALALTWRIRVVNDASYRTLRQAGHPFIFAFWHGHMLPLLWEHRRQRIAILISDHGDGELIARVAHSLGLGTVRGSTTRGAQRALLATIRRIQEGWDFAITPDGPRGPREQFAPGALAVAQRTGAPIILMVISARRQWVLASWDRFRIPKPFTRVTIAYSDPIYITAASAREAAAEAPRLQEMLQDLAARTDG